MIQDDWQKVFDAFEDREYFKTLKQTIRKEQKNYTIYPPKEKIFSAFSSCSFKNTRAVIVGQDPYHGFGQANGLCFSVGKEVSVPPSLVNIFKELNSDLGLPIPSHGDLSSWAKSGVLLLNSSLTVRANEPNSHQFLNWKRFTDYIIEYVSKNKMNVVFILWGKFAGEKNILIDETKHLILKAAHPSPFSANRGFLGCKHFSKTNTYLEKKGLEKIDWGIHE